MNFLFWNLNRNPITNLVATIAVEHEIDVLILAESGVKVTDLLVALNNNQTQMYSLVSRPSERILIFVRLPPDSIRRLRDIGGLSIRTISPPIGTEITLVAVHFSSKMFQDSVDQALTAPRFARIIEEEENKVGHKRTVIVGDFNMDPFEPGMAGGEALHGVMDRVTALKLSRTIEGQRRSFFYNPMWSRMGDISPGPPGTYYRYNSKQLNYFWNTFDQVLIRPELIWRFQDENFEVLTRAGDTSLAKHDGKPNAKGASDHFPIKFALDLVAKEG